MPVSARQLAANRRNAKKSCGPKTPETKAVSAQNNLKHGLCGRFRVLAGESQAEYDDLLARFMRTEQPADDVEQELVAKMCRHTWMSERAVRCQDACFEVQPRSAQDDPEDNRIGFAVRADLEVYVRYQAAQDRAYQRASNELAKRRAARQKAQNGFESQKRKEAEETRKAELHQHKLTVARARAEREQANATIASIRAADKIVSSLPPDFAPTESRRSRSGGFART